MERKKLEKSREENIFYLQYVDKRNKEIDHKYDVMQRELDEEESKFYEQRQIERKNRRYELY